MHMELNPWNPKETCFVCAFVDVRRLPAVAPRPPNSRVGLARCRLNAVLRFRQKVERAVLPSIGAIKVFLT